MIGASGCGAGRGTLERFGRDLADGFFLAACLLDAPTEGGEFRQNFSESIPIQQFFSVSEFRFGCATQTPSPGPTWRRD